MINKIRNKILFTTLFAFTSLFVLGIPLVSAAITVTISTPSSVTQGSNIPISASFVVGSGESGTFYFTCDQTSSGEVSPESGYSVTTSTSKTYTFTPSQATTYTNCKVSDGGTQSSSATTITSIAPTALTVAGSPSSTTSSSFTLSINITNPTGSTVTTSYSLSCTSVGTCSGDQTSANIDISSGSSTSLSWTVTASSSGTITFQLGSNSNAFSTTVSLPSATATTTTTQRSAAGLGTTTTQRTNVTTTTTTTTTPPVVETKIVSTVAAGGTAKFEFAEASKLKIESVSVIVNKAKTNIAVTVKESSLPSGASEPVAVAVGTVYKYIELTKSQFTDSDITSAKIKFKVEKTWIISNSIDDNKVYLFRYADNAWSKLTTSKVSSDANYVYYEAQSTALSVFAIGGEKLPSAITTTTTTIMEEVAAIGELALWQIVAIIVVIAAVIVFVLYKKGILVF